MDKPDKRPGVQTDAVNSESQNLANDPPEDRQPIDELDKPRTYKDAADALGVRYHTVQRAARRGLVPTYHLGHVAPVREAARLLRLDGAQHKTLTGA